MNNKRNYKYYAGIYARISKDNGIRNESGENICVNKIGTQKIITDKGGLSF